MTTVTTIVACASGSSCTPPAQPVPPVPAGDEAGHDHAEHCWIGEQGRDVSETIDNDALVDMQLFVVGLNHRAPNPAEEVGVPGIQQLAELITAAWPHPDRVVVVSSAFGRTCPPASTSATCLKTELEQRYGSKFGLFEVNDSAVEPWSRGTRGVLWGSRWVAQETQRMDVKGTTEKPAARVLLRDSVTGLRVDVLAMHTGANEEADNELASIAGALVPKINSNSLLPIFAGDFNFREIEGGHILGAAEAAAFVGGHFTWINKDVPCADVGGLPNGTFTLQNGHVMHVLAGKYTDAQDDSGLKFPFKCAVGELERVRLSYSVNRAGSLAVRKVDGRSAVENGIVLDEIEHNVLAIGLRIRRRAGDPPPDCRPNGAECFCRARGRTCGMVDPCGNKCECFGNAPCVNNECLPLGEQCGTRTCAPTSSCCLDKWCCTQSQRCTIRGCE